VADHAGRRFVALEDRQSFSGEIGQQLAEVVFVYLAVLSRSAFLYS
jgi:hypothetical protein